MRREVGHDPEQPGGQGHAGTSVALVADPFVLSPSGDGSAPYIPGTLTDY